MTRSTIVAITLATTISGCSFTGASPAGASFATTKQRPIQEADIYKLVGNTLYILNASSGLQIVDVTNPQSPTFVGHVPVADFPRQIYVDGNTAYVLVSGGFNYNCGGYQGVCGWQAQSGISTEILAIDVTNPAVPAILANLQIDGDLQDSRIVGHILYVVSDTDSLTYVASFDISDPHTLKKIAEQDFKFDQWDVGIFLNVTDARIILAEAGDNCDATGGSNCSEQDSITQFQPIDITDPSGAIKLGVPFTEVGIVADRWAMDFDPATGLFRAVLTLNSPHVSSGGGALVTWSAPTIGSATRLGSVTFSLGDNITAAAFDGPRVYISTTSNVTSCPDPVAIFDTTDPVHPAQLGSVALPGAIDFLYPQGKQLVGLGHADVSCKAFEGTGQLAVSLFDVSNGANPTLKSQVWFGGQSSTVAASRSDLKKVFLVLSSLGLILVPYQSPDSTSSRGLGSTQLIDFNASGLTLRGMSPHPGLVERAFPAQSDANDVIAFSEQSLQVIDIGNRDKPATIAELSFPGLDGGM